jgi:hypothetical protein
MSTNPFYRFEQSNWNTGFEPAFTPTVDALYGFTTDIPSGFGVGAYLGFALQLIQNFIDERNAAPYHFNFVLVPSYPIPLPPVGTGTQSWQYYITDLQLIAVNPAQKYVMDITTTDGIIDALTVTENTDTSYPYNYALPLFQTEIEAYRALEIAHQNGAAFFPSEYTYDSITGIATSSVARLQDCKFNEATGFGDRYPLITAPVSPYWSLNVPAMSADEKYMVLLMNKIITYGLNNTKTALDIDIFVLNLILPEGYYVLGGYDLTGYPRVQYTFSNPTTKEAVGLIGRFDIVWKWQRFYSAGIEYFFTSTLAVMEATSPTTQLPYSPIIGKSYSTFIEDKKNWYDFEQIEFTDACAIPVEYYPMPAKTADHMQFNVIPESSNMIGVTSAKVGLFDCNENFIQQIGIAKTSGILIFNFNLPNTFTSPCDSLTKAALFEDTITYSSILPSYTQVCNTSGGIVLDWLNNFVADLTIGFASYIVISGGYRLTWTITNWDQNFIPLASLGYTTSFGPIITWHNCFEGTLCTNPTQLQASIDIPSVSTGEYKLGLYNQSESALEIYAISNPIRIDNSDCFSKIIEFYANPSSIAQGFEYYGDWRQRIRVGLNGGGAKPRITEATYRQSNGVYKRPQNKQDLTLDLHTDFFDEPTQFAMTDATRHPFLVWNDKNIFVEGDIEVATVQDFTTQSSFEDLAQMKFSVLVQGFQPKNNSCINC